MPRDPLDYSPHVVKSMACIRDMYAALLKNKHDVAIQDIEHAIVELRLAKAAVQDIKECRS